MTSRKSWPDSTLAGEPEDQAHYCGSRWDPFFDSPDEVFRSLPEVIPQAAPLRTFGDTYSGPHKIPESWAKGGHLAWPNGNRGLIATLRVTEERTDLTNTSPFAGNGMQVGIDIETVHVWSSGAEAQIEGTWGELVVSFFDLTFLSNRSWYESGQRRDFVLAAIAYKAGPPAVENLALDPDSPLADWLPEEARIVDGAGLDVCLKGSSVFVPVQEWDRDDYWFRGPARAVRPFDEWLGQSGWRVKVCVMQWDSEDVELEVFVTSRAWTGQEPPQVGQDIEGTLWLQGRLWWAG